MKSSKKKATWKNNLDERQEQALLQIEHRGCWFAFWALLVSFLVEQFVFGFGVKEVAGEWIIFMLLAFYMMISCIKEGIWDRHLKPNASTNFIVSLIAGGASMILMFLFVLLRFPDKLYGSILSGIFTGIIVFVLCMIALNITSAATIKKQKQLEEEPFEEDER